jgi:hypothetical protein
MLTADGLIIKAMLKTPSDNWPILEQPTLDTIAGMFPAAFSEDMLFADPATGRVIHKPVVPTNLSQEYIIGILKKIKVVK